jgi:hypothetical protein
MLNIVFELEKLRFTLERKGLDHSTIDIIVKKVNNEINQVFDRHAQDAMQKAVELGVERESADFINELKIDGDSMMLTTQSGNTDFSEPPFPMLPALLRNAKPMKDGSGVYKIIPVGKPGNKPKISTNIYDAVKQINAQRAEEARKQYSAVAPAQSKFRTASSKQDQNTKWVKPAKDKDFYSEMNNINIDLERTMEEAVRDIIRGYEEGF